MTIPAPTVASAVAPPVPPAVRLAHVEISRFRRLGAARVDVDAETTILVGANNSGKTSILNAIRQFLADSPGFGAFDLSVDQWAALRALGDAWEKLDQNPTTGVLPSDDWAGWLTSLLACMPTLDLWFEAQDSGFNYVFPFVPSLKWNGGLVGLRLRLEPASSVKDLQQLAWRYREARRPVVASGAPDGSGPALAGAWPTNLLDYWLRYPTDLSRVVAYKLDPAKGPGCAAPDDGPQPLPEPPTPIAKEHVSRLIRVDFIAAQRGLGTEEADGRPGSDPHRVGQFSHQVLRFVRQHLNPTGTTANEHPELVRAIVNAQNSLDDKIHVALGATIDEVKALGYPGLHDPQQMHVRTRIQTTDLLDHSTAVQYSLDGGGGALVPEHSIGLGYQNLQSLSYQLVGFRQSRLNPTKGAPAPVHLVMIEEPEAHLHVQVQRVFTRKALARITPKDAEHSHLSTQLLISTHASHLAHAESFTRLRYLRRSVSAAGMAGSKVINLADVFGDAETRTFAERYFRVQHTDLLFADAAIFVEGTAERMLVPLFIENEVPDLTGRYLSFVDIGGSHAHRLRPLVERLGIPTVVITDIDPMVPADAKTPKSKPKAAPIEDAAVLVCGNATLRQWHAGVASDGPLDAYRHQPRVVKGSAGSTYFAWQLPVAPENLWPSSFEDALILTNRPWFVAQAQESGVLGKAGSVVADCTDQSRLQVDLHTLLRGSFDKGDFAATIFERMTTGEALECPAYIKDALGWLREQLEPTMMGGAS